MDSSSAWALTFEVKAARARRRKELKEGILLRCGLDTVL